MSGRCARLVIVGDVHLRARPPRSRRDDYAGSMIAKLRDIGTVIRQEAADGAVLLGDVFDAPEISLAVVAEALETFDDWGLIYTIAGNHDVYGQNHQTLWRTMLGHILLREEKFVYIGDAADLCRWVPLPGNWALAGLDYRPGVEEMLLSEEQGNLWCSRMEGRYVALAVHAQITPKDFPWGPSLRPAQCRWPVALLMGGHYHPGVFGHSTGHGMPFVNPGAVCRLAYLESNLTRMPQVAVVDLLEGGRSTVRLVPLPSAKTHEEVFNADEAIARRSLEGAAEAMIGAVMDVAGTVQITPEEAVKTVAKEIGSPEDVVEDVLERLQNRSAVK